MSELKRIDQILAHLKRQQTLGGMTYQKAVDVEILTSAFERIRAELIVEDLKASAKPKAALDIILQ